MSIFINQTMRKISAISMIAMLTAPTIAQELPAENNESEESEKIEVIEVTARSLSTPNVSSALPIQILSGKELAHRRQGGLGETLAGLPGIHLDNFGGGASRPVIRGQTLPRIEILSDGANLFDISSVSPDHAITTDPLLLDAIEILRGPTATRYGGNALNGAINLIDSKVPRTLPEGNLSGAMEVRYGSGDEEETTVGRVTTGIGQFAVHAEGAQRSAGDYDVPDSFGSNRLSDSFAENSSYSFGGSWITSKGYFGAAYTRVDSEYGLPGHNHTNGVCHPHGTSLHCETHDEFDDPFGSPDSDTAYIDLRSERVDVRGDFADLLPGFENVRIRSSYTDYNHDEIDGSSLFAQFTNEVYDSHLELSHRPLFGFTGTLGVQYTDGKFGGLDNIRIHQGEESFISYDTENVGIFLNESLAFGVFDIELALRKDWRNTTIPFPNYKLDDFPLDEVEWYEESYGPNWQEILREQQLESHSRVNLPYKEAPFSSSVSGTWNIDDGYSTSLTLSRTERTPNFRELYANGNNLATNSYELGFTAFFRPSSLPERRNDVIEKTNSIDLTLRKVDGPVEFEVGVFSQHVDDYIFARLVDIDNVTGSQQTFLAYTATNARFEGIDGQVSYRFGSVSRLIVFGDYVDAELKNEKDNVPRIPPGRVGTRYEFTVGSVSGDVEYYHTFTQDKFSSYETQTSGSNMLNATLAYRFDLGSANDMELYVRGTNLLNELVFAHTSFVKEQSPLRGLNIALGMQYQF
jgi:iron complex outermembrane recepter protein